GARLGQGDFFMQFSIDVVNPRLSLLQMIAKKLQVGTVGESAKCLDLVAIDFHLSDELVDQVSDILMFLQIMIDVIRSRHAPDSGRCNGQHEKNSGYKPSQQSCTDLDLAHEIPLWLLKENKALCFFSPDH